MPNAYIAIDLKSFYASVECVERGLDLLTTNLVVADESRTEKTICLAATPSLKSYGIPSRARLFEVVQKTREVNNLRRAKAPNHKLTGESCDAKELATNPSLAVAYIVAKPRMALYVEYSTRIYDIYLNYIAPNDMHIYSIDEVFIDAAPYLKTYGLTAHELALNIIRDVLRETGITAAAGIGTNMYLAKIAMDIVAKKMPADKDGVRIAELDEMSYRRQLWEHSPVTDFWRVGKGYAKKLREHGMLTMGDVARCSIDKHGEKLLHKLFGVNAELLIDHAWGYEPCTMAAIKGYRPMTNSLSSGQVLQEPYTNANARLIVCEMTDLLVLDLVEKRLVTDQIVLDVVYDVENKNYEREVHIDRYGRAVPKPAHGSANLGKHTSSTKVILVAVLNLYDRITDKNLFVRRVTVTANHVIDERRIEKDVEQFDLFDDYDKIEREERERQKEKSIQQTIIAIKHKFGKNAILKGANLRKEGTTIERNEQIGGHKA